MNQVLIIGQEEVVLVCMAVNSVALPSFACTEDDAL